MRTVFWFCLSLFFLLSGKNDAHPGVHQRISHAPAEHVQKIQQASPGKIAPGLQYFIKNGVTDKNDDSSIENDDEEIEFGSGHSHLAKQQLSAAQSTLISYFYFYHSCSQHFLLSCQQPSFSPTSIYILQRVLRI